MSPPIYTPDGSEVSEIVLPDGSTASEVIGPDGNVVFEAVPNIPDSALTQDLVAWYRFEDGDARDYTATLDATFADSTAYDGTVNGATFQSNGGVTDFRSGANSGAYDFDGTDDNISTPFSVGLSDFTLMGWINVDDSTRNTLLANERATVGDGIIFGVDSGVLEFDNFAAYGNASGGTITTDTWYHIAMTSETTAYIDGSQVATETAASLPNPRDMLIGRIYESDSTYNGVADDVRIYNRALTSSEISDIYNATKP